MEQAKSAQCKLKHRNFYFFNYFLTSLSLTGKIKPVSLIETFDYSEPINFIKIHF